MSKTTLAAAVAAAMMATLGVTTDGENGTNHSAAFNRQRAQYVTPKRHLTKKGPGRKGAHSKRGQRDNSRYCDIGTGAIRTRNKLLGTRG